MRTILLLLTLTICILPPMAYARSDAEARAAQETFIPEIRLLESQQGLGKYGIHFAHVLKDTFPGGGKYFCGGLSESQAVAAADIVETALLALPAGAWNKISLKYVLLCNETKAQNRIIGGIPVPPIELLMLSVGKAQTGGRLPYNALHELYHMVEFQNNAYHDNDWNSKFGGYSENYNATDTQMGSGGLGFINAYGKTFPHEERAELFAERIYAPQGLAEHLKAQPDSVLVNKVLYMQQKCTQLMGEDACK